MYQSCIFAKQTQFPQIKLKGKKSGKKTCMIIIDEDSDGKSVMSNSNQQSYQFPNFNTNSQTHFSPSQNPFFDFNGSSDQSAPNFNLLSNFQRKDYRMQVQERIDKKIAMLLTSALPIRNFQCQQQQNSNSVSLNSTQSYGQNQLKSKSKTKPKPKQGQRINIARKSSPSPQMLQIPKRPNTRSTICPSQREYSQQNQANIPNMFSDRNATDYRKFLLKKFIGLRNREYVNLL